MARIVWILAVICCLAGICQVTEGYLAIISSNLSPGTLIFEAGVPQLGGKRKYDVSGDRTARFARKLLKVNPHNGRVTLARKLNCDGLQYPRLFTFYIDSTSSRLGRPNIDYYSLPLRVLITGCGDENQDLAATKGWMAETLASYAMPSTEKFTEICLRRSQLVAGLRDFLPHTALKECETRWDGVADSRFLIEGTGGDLVSASEQCLIDPLWKISVSMTLRCSSSLTHLVDTEHRLKIVFHHQQLDDTDLGRRVRRELKNRSPFFEHGLYTAAVEEEKEPGELVTIVRARDPEGGTVHYSMQSLLDARSTALFLLDSITGKVTTRAKLDRESVELHYFKVLAVDDSFPPRTGTTTLQINVLDANDHPPTFEWPEYEAPIRETVPLGSTVIAVKATDKDSGRNAEVEYNILSTTGGGTTSIAQDSETFRIDQKSGVVTTRMSLDREKTEVYTVLITASDLSNTVSLRKTATTTLIVRILDDNDNYPQFSERSYSTTIPEDIDYTTNPIIAHIQATDADSGPNAAIRYNIIGGNTQNTFSIDSLSGDVTLVKPLDYETIDLYRIVVRAQDGGAPARSNTTQLLVHVEDVNDNAPRFFTSLLQETVSEGVPIGYSVVRVQAYDGDKGLNALIKYYIGARDINGGSTENIPISVNPETGWIHTTKQLDREICSRYQFTVVAIDSGEPPKSGSATVVITITDINDNDPKFESKNYEAVVSEDDPPGTSVSLVTATDPDEDSKIHYDITAGNSRARFSITSQNGGGLITVAQPLDYKQEKRFVLTVTASDSGGRMDTALVYINISDANNFAPIFENAPYSVSVFEDAPIGTTVLVVSATDSDVGQNAQVTYSLGTDSDDDDGNNKNNDNSEFTINPQTGAITTTRPLDRERTSGYLLTVTAKDGGVPGLSDTTDVEISVTDVNDNPPVFEAAQYTGTVPEDVLVGTSVVRVSATDADQGLNGRVRYTLDDDGDGAFAIDSTTGIVRTAKQLDRESVMRYTLKAMAVDRGIPALSSIVPIIIKIEDVNDSPPAFESDKIILYIPENSPIGSTVGEIYAHDPDEGLNAVVQYSIIGGEDANSFTLNTRPGSDRAELITLEELDYESQKKKYEIFVRAASPPLRSDVLVQIMITDINDNAPVLKDFQIIFNNFKDFFPTKSIGKIPAVDADVTDKLYYNILSGNNANLITLNKTTGEIILSPQLNTNVPRIATMEVSVSDGVNQVKATMTLSVRLITDKILYNSITVRLDDMTVEAFLSPLLNYFIDGLAAIIPCPRENIFIFSVQQDTDVNGKILNVSFSARKVEPGNIDEFYTSQYLQERVYLNRGILARLSTLVVLPFDDNLCVREPCLNFEDCITVLKFGNASGFATSNTILFRPIYPVTTFSCQCPRGFTGSKESYLCDMEVNLCFSNPCKNGGTCKRKEGGYTCICDDNYTGDNCQLSLNQSNICAASHTTDNNNYNVCKNNAKCIDKLDGGFTCESCPIIPLNTVTQFCELRARSFGPSTFLTFPSLKQRHRLNIKLKFATESSQGLLLYNGRYNEKHDFIALEIINSELQFSFSLGDKITRATAAIPGGVSDGQWHTVNVNYINRTVTITIDDCDIGLALHYGKKLGDKWSCAGTGEQILEPRCNLITETCHRFLDLTGPMQLGGLPSIPSDFQITNKDFIGCISDLYIDYKFIDLNSYVADNGTIVGCPEKYEFCLSSPCNNNGKCREIWSGYICECQEGFSGPQCSEEISKPWRFHGDGLLSFNPLLRPIQLPWMTAFSLRTRAVNSFIMNIQIGQNSSALFYLKDGKLATSLDGIEIIKTKVPINNGEWQRIEIIWQTGLVSLDINYRNNPLISSLPAKLQGLYVGRILLGGPDQSIVSSSSSSSSSTTTANTNTIISSGIGELQFYEGCIQDLRIGTNQSILQRPTVQENIGIGCTDDSECSVKCPEKSSCIKKWQASECVCDPGYVGEHCEAICDINPCHSDSGICLEENSSKRGYKCQCNSEEYTGEYCEVRVDQSCPTTWWGSPVCGPCYCDESKGYDPSCNKTNGECYCKKNHYQPPNGEKDQCIPCNCYTVGSRGPRCDPVTGQCRCLEGVIGRACTDCANPYAEVTSTGCQVIYNGCPKSYAGGLWWPQTLFNKTGDSPVVVVVFENCPGTAQGMASRQCDSESGGWQSPDLFNCTSDIFIQQRYNLAAIENSEMILNRDIAVKIARDLNFAVKNIKNMYGADVLIAESLFKLLLKYEESQADLHLTHNQDKDYVPNLVGIAGGILNKKYKDTWLRIEELNGDSTDKILDAMARYLKILTNSQHNTFTDPFEVVDPFVIMGMDTVTSESLFGYESTVNNGEIFKSAIEEIDKKVILPDTSSFLSTPTHLESYISFPKYNNYIADPRRFDPYSKIRVPLSLLGIKGVSPGEIKNNENEDNNEKAVLSYVQYKELGSLLPKKFDDSVNVRWGVEVAVGSPVITISILIPSDNGTKLLSNNPQSPVQIQLWISEDDGTKIRINPQCVHWSTARNSGEWSRIGCTTDIDDSTIDYYYLNPDNNNNNNNLERRKMINCSCQGVILQVKNLQLATFAVLTDVLDLEYVPEPSLLEDVTSYSAFMLSLPLLLSALLILTLIRGSATNSNSIHKNLVLCVFMGELLYLIALKARSPLVSNEFTCKLTAIGLHYSWLSAFAWTLVDSIHLYRMLTEMRDVNHGQMRFYYTIGYAIPAIIVGLTIGVRADQYGNFYFCWLSIYETVVWSLIGPICLAVVINFLILIISVKAAFTLKEHIMGFGNLRTLLWLSVASLPLLGATWTLAVLSASENSPILSYLLSVSIVVHSSFSLIGYCFINGRVRRNFYLSLLRCFGKKSPLLESSMMVNGSSSQNINGQSRSALAYNSNYISNGSGMITNVGTTTGTCRRVHVGVSTSSTTSRSTNKTGSSPYRSDVHLRHTSTSTSNYNSDRDPYMMSSTRSKKNRNTQHSSVNNPNRNSNKIILRNSRRDSESDESDGSHNDDDTTGGRGSAGRSLDLASSHSSDDDDVTSNPTGTDSNNINNKNNKRKIGLKTVGVSTQQQQQVTHNYLPNIHQQNSLVGDNGSGTDHLNILCSNTDLFPNIKPIYAPRWSSQLPEAYLPTNIDIRSSQWSGGTISDNEIASNKTSSPNPLPYPPDDISSPLKFGGAGEHDNNYSEGEDKISSNQNYNHIGGSYSGGGGGGGGGEKYLFPYTAEEDHTVSPTPYLLSMSSRILGSSLSHHSHNSNQDNHSGSERYGSLKRGQSQSLHGSLHDNLNAVDRYGSLKRGKITPTVLEDMPEYILPITGRILSSSLTHDLHHSNELAALRHHHQLQQQQQQQLLQQQQQQQQQHYEQTITETEKDINAETPV
ncbi:protocadherin-like wing polarity protein stan isoform X2 [Cotesia glomerata]|uniref:protocadherin-like wing polarity protein stan isoform X2 n=1 Tax=Cotesia glomerata TaxID=32391 RepID=UPI001D016601|nr:protocadherin-like wing polarity protein stan isoform X2 [Cotesia glomerata]